LLSVPIVRPRAERPERINSTVLIVGPFPPPVHGASLVTSLITERVAERGNVVVSNISPDNLERGLRYHVTRVFRVFASAWRLVRCSRTAGRGVYMSVAGGGGILYNIVLLLLARVFGYRIFLHHHSHSYINCRNQLMALLVWIGGRATIHICMCVAMANELRNVYPKLGVVTILSNAAIVPRGTPSRHPRETGIRLGHLGNLFLEKGLDTVIDLFRAICRQGIGGRLLLAGPAPTPESAAIINEAIREFGDVIEYRGPVYGEAKKLFFRDIDVFIFPSCYHETQPLVIFEAMSSGVPVIAYARGCIGSDLANGGGVGIPTDHDFLGTALRVIGEWAEDREKLERASRAAFDRAERLREDAQDGLNRLVDLLTVKGN